ncbi:MAG: peptidylprolyl isomerase [Actinomycetota bacterium]|nr:peptidylprolyl isomerase [Actinomycetota bacterium]
MKRAILWGTFFLLLVSIIALTGCTQAAAVVNGEKIDSKEIDTYFNFFKTQDTQGLLDQDQQAVDDMQTNILDSLIVVKLLQQYAQQEGIAVSDEDAEKQLQEIIATYPSEQEFDQALETMTIDRGFLTRELKNQLLRAAIFDQVTAEVEVTAEEAQSFYEENKESLFLVPEKIEVSHILAKYEVEEGQTEITEEVRKAARDKIEFVQQELEEGQDFKQVAQEYSDDTASAENGGELGLVAKGEMIESFEQVAFSLGIGEISDIVETEYGYHLIYVTDKQEEYIKDLDEVKETVIAYIENEEKNQVWADFIYSLIDIAEIEYKTDIKSQLNEKPPIEGGDQQ